MMKEDEEEEREAVEFPVEVVCPYCDRVIEFDFVDSDDDLLQTAICPDCLGDFAMRPTFTVTVEVFTIKRVSARRRKKMVTVEKGAE